MTLKTRITTAIATGAVLLNALAPLALANTITESGNGAFSDNTVKLNNDTKTVVDQTNDAHVSNNISSNASTGGNSASFNTGGDTKIVTGNAGSNVDVNTAVNLNKADISNCGACQAQDTNIKISGNGAYSDNQAKVSNDNKVKLSQDNNADITNKINANATTGKNDSSFNTGGSSIIGTGDAYTNVSVNNKANANMAKIGGGGSGNSYGNDVVISGNGAFSDNKAKLDNNSAVVLDQNNNADIYNKISAKADTGHNDAAFNTGGRTAIITGNAGTNVDVNNLANFNAASVGCDCFIGGTEAKISGNGADSLNKISANNNDFLKNNQDNYSKLYNDVYGNAKTGKNDVSFSTGNVHGDPFIYTGDAYSSTGVNNESNVNLFNKGFNFHLPGNVDVHTQFDLSGLLNFFHLG